MFSITPHTCVYHLLIYFSSSHFSLFLTLMFSPLFATMACASLSLNGKHGFTALIGASDMGHTAIVQLLLEAGADEDAQDKVREKRYNYTQRHM
jgi:ankyrin repeat protein